MVNMDPMSMLLLVTRSEFTFFQLMLVGLVYVWMNYRISVKHWYEHYEHKYRGTRSLKTMEFTFTTSKTMDGMYNSFESGAYRKIDEVTRSVLWMFFNDPSKNYRQISKQVVCRDSFMLDEKFSNTLDWPGDAQTYQLANGLSVRFYLDVKNTEPSSNSQGQNQYKQEIATYTIHVMSRKLNHGQIAQMVQENLDKYQKWVKSVVQGKMFILYSYLQEKELCWKNFALKTTKTFSNMFFEHKQLLIERLDNYMNDSESYQRLGIPHTLGLLLHGEPGTGKTSVIKAIANHMKRSIVNINMKHFNNIHQIRCLFMNGKYACLEAGRNERIYVFEEIDCSVDDMENNPFLSRELVQQHKKNNMNDSSDILKAVCEAASKKDTKNNATSSTAAINVSNKASTITTGDILEVLDGVGETDDRVIIFTTNHPEMLDKAFLRPGRIDLNLEFKKLRRVDMDDLYNLWFKTRIPKDTLNKMKDYTVSQAEMGQLCFTHKKHPERIIEELLKK